MRILCVSAQLPGHLDWGGYLATAVELQHRGHEVVWASGVAVAERVGRAGLPFHGLLETGWRWPPPPPLTPEGNADPQSIQQQRQLRALDQWLETEQVAKATRELQELISRFRPELILSEMFIAAAGLAAEASSVPLVVMGWPAPVPQTVTGADVMAAIARKRLDELLARFSLQGINWTSNGPPALSSPVLHLTYWSPSWFAGMAVGSQTVHVGGLRPQPRGEGYLQAALALGEPSLPSPEDAPWVLITLGTSFNIDPNFFIAAAHASVQLGCLPLLAIGAPLEREWVQTIKPRLPMSVVMRPYLDFDTVLPYVAAAIHHGGAGTTHALVRHAVPQIVVPHAADQMRQAQGVMRSRVGHYLPAKEVTIPRLVEALAQVLPDLSPWRAQAVALQAEFDALGGVPAAADRIEELAG
jgi:UDP:flavonoid glycosyltransferase YjiC (YdhE family)